jgi:hypothetical protein
MNIGRVALGKAFIARRQFMRGTDPIKSKWVCLKILVYRYIDMLANILLRKIIQVFILNIILFVVLCSFTAFNLM